jgi:hypothetical protein
MPPIERPTLTITTIDLYLKSRYPEQEIISIYESIDNKLKAYTGKK